MICKSHLIMLLPAGVLVACGPHAGPLRDVNMSGTSFNQKLAQDYRGFAIYEEEVMYDQVDAAHFAQKSLAAHGGTAVQPEDPEKWNIENSEAKAELHTARARLLDALTKGAAQKAPAAAARAQVKYDCWVEQQEEGWQHSHIQACKDGFMKAMARIDDSLNRPRQVAAVVTPPKPVQPRDQSFLVFFDFDRANVTPQAEDILEQTVRNARSGSPSRIVVTGHADRAGPTQYNENLARQRAENVRRELMRRGIGASDIVVTAKGESDPLVPTPDGVREPQNRRVEIMF